MDQLEEQFKAANDRAASRLSETPVAMTARYDRRIGRIVVELSSGLGVMFSPHDAQGLQDAHIDQLRDIEITPSGLGLHFPQLDADLYLPAILEGLLGSRKWIAAENGRRGGQKISEAKTTSARENGKLGGRPRKIPVPA